MDGSGFDWGDGSDTQAPNQGMPNQGMPGQMPNQGMPGQMPNQGMNTQQSWGSQSGGLWGQTSGVESDGGWDAPQSDNTWDVPGETQDSWTDPVASGADPNQGNQPLQEISGGKPPVPPAVVVGVVFVVIILVAFLVLATSRTNVKKKPAQSQQHQTTQQSSQPTQSSSQGSSAKTDSVALIRIPDSTAMNYSGDVLQATGTVTGKTKYLIDSQVVYCINLNISVGSASQSLYFFCNYATFSSVANGDLVAVSYQQVQDNFISVISVTK